MIDPSRQLRVRCEALFGALNSAEIDFLAHLAIYPHRFNPTTASSVAMAFAIGKLYSLGLVYVDEGEEGEGALITLSEEGFSIVERHIKNYAYFT